MDVSRNLKIESVSRLNPTPPWQVKPSQSVAEAVALMRAKSVGCVLVCENQRMIGIFTERDLLRRVMGPGKPLSAPVGETMTPNPVTVHPKDSIATAIRRMEVGGYRHLPVVVDEKPVGILSVKRIVHYLVEHFPATVYNLPPNGQGRPPRREGA